MTEKKGCFEKACHPRLRAGISSLALFAAFALSACTDYVEEYESEYRADYGNADVFEQRLNDVSKWDWNSVCQSGDAIWEWCFESDGKYALTSFAGSAWESFVDGDARLVFSGTNNSGQNYSTNLLTEDNVLHMLRRSGGLRVEVADASGNFSAGVQVKLQNDELDKSIYPAMVLYYTNECSDAFAGLKYVDGDGKVVSEYRWDKLAVGEQLSSTLKFDDLHYVSGEKDEDFLKKANTFEVGLSGCSDSKKGVMVYAVGVVYDTKNEGKSSSSSDDVVLSGSDGSSSSTKSSSSEGSSNGNTTTSSSVSSDSNTENISVACEGTAIAGGITWEPSVDVSGISDQEYSSLKYSWVLEGGSPSKSSEKRVFASYNKDGEQYTAKLTVTASTWSKTAECHALAIYVPENKSSSSAKSSSSEDGFLWRGGVDKSDLVKTDFGRDKWFFYKAEQDNTQLLSPQSNRYDICYGYCGKVYFGEGYVDTKDNYVAPFGNLSVLVNNGEEVDVSDKWNGGVCITYASDRDSKLYIALNSEDENKTYGFAMPEYNLPATTAGSPFTTVQVKWDQFKQPLWASEQGKAEITGAEVAKKLRKIQVNFDGSYGMQQNFNIYEIGSFGRCGKQDPMKEWNQESFEESLDKSGVTLIEPYSTAIDQGDLLWYAGNKLKGGSSYLVNEGFEYEKPWLSDDAKDGSCVEWETPLYEGNEITDKLIVDCGGAVCGTMKSFSSKNPLIGFNVPKKDVKEWGGICLTYKANNAEEMMVYLGISDATAAGSFSYDWYRVLLPKNGSGNTIDTCYAWSDFIQGGWGPKRIEEYLPKVDQIVFTSVGSKDVDFSLVAIGKYPASKGGNDMFAWDFLNPDFNYNEFTDTRDGRKYRSIKIGNYEWMAENMNIDRFEGFCANNDSRNCAKYGRLYPPDKNVCPAGWHLPIKEEFEDLVSLAGGGYPHGHKLRSLSGWEKPGTDDYGFSAAPGGYANSVGDMINLTKEASFWGTLNDTSDTWYDNMRIYYTGDLQVTTDVSSGRKSIRCVKGNYVNACRDDMPTAAGTAHNVTQNMSGSISGTPWGYQQWSAGGSNSMTYYDNGTFKANWTSAADYMVRVGYFYNKNGTGVNVKNTHYSADYKYAKTGSAQYGYIGAYGWTVDPMVEFFIVDDWFTKPVENYIGPKQGEFTVDGATYSIHAYVRDQEASEWGTDTFLQIYSVRETPRQCGHINIQAHFDKWNELFKGQTASLPGSKGAERSIMLKFGNVISVNLLVETGGAATGSVEYTYFNMSE